VCVCLYVCLNALALWIFYLCGAGEGGGRFRLFAARRNGKIVRKRARVRARARARAREQVRERESENECESESTGWQTSIEFLNCRFLSAKEPLITGLFCGKRPMNKRHLMHLLHSVEVRVKVKFGEREREREREKEGDREKEGENF